MPYIITTTQTYGAQWEAMADPYPPQSRIAVATLDEARAAVWAMVFDSKSQRIDGSEVDALPENGGTVGPLPDETVIEVARADTIVCPGNEFHGPCGKSSHWRDGVSLGGLYPDGAWECSDQRCWTMTTLDAYNAAQEG